MKNRSYPLYELREYSSLIEMIVHKAEKLNEKIAFQYMKRNNIINVSYKQFLDDVIRAKQYFNTLYGIDKHIAILGENSYLWLVMFAGIIMSDNVAVLLDKELNPQELKNLLDRSDSEICICSERYLKVAEEMGKERKQFVLLSMNQVIDTNNVMSEYDIKNGDIVPECDKTAAIFFTSGTSGQSKGVMLSQANMITDINMACKNVILSGTVLTVLPFHHAFGLITAVFATFNYEQIVFINTSLKTVKRDMVLAKPETMMVVPLFIETFYKSIWKTAKDQKNEWVLQKGMWISRIFMTIGIDIRKLLFKAVLENFGGNLKFIICGGAALLPKYISEFRLWGIEILNGYGITECSPVIAVNRNNYYRDGSVGEILPGSNVRIWENDNNGIGEIQVKGSNVMLGYYQDSVETKNAFTNGWFKTGDLGYIDKDGFLYITGRKKNLIILSNGENVSPEELEEKIMQIIYVKEVVVSEKNGLIRAEVFLDVELEKDATKKIYDDIKNLNKSIPNYKKIEKVIIREEEFEKTSTKKIKRAN